MSKTAMMIAYYFPPLGMGGVQRMTKLAKYLPQWGYDVAVLTVKPIRYPAHDHSLLDELPDEVSIYRAGSSDPARIGKFIPLPQRASKLKAMARQKSSRFWPDSKVGWQRPAIKLAEKIMSERKIDVILSSSPPISAHMIAMELKKRCHIPWVADFRDLWESRPPEDVYTNTDMVTRSIRLLDDIQSNADAVTRVSDAILKDVCPNAVTIRGGYDEDDFGFLPTVTPDKTFTLCHMGTIHDLNPIEPYFKAARTLAESLPDFEKDIRFKFVGVIDNHMITRLGKEYNFSKQVEMTGYLPHRDALRTAATSAALLLSIDAAYPGILTGKILDYMAMPIPILACAAIGGEIHKIIDQYRAGFCVDHADIDTLTQHMKTLYENHRSGRQWDKADVSTFTRRESARMFTKIFDRIQRG